MKKIILIIICFLLPFCGISQILQFDIGESYYISCLPEKYCERFNSKDELPESVNKIISNVFTSQTDLDISKLKFNFCEIYDVDKYLTDYPDSINKYSLPIPKYIAVYSWSDTTIGVKKYNIELFMDNFGQIIYFNFPHQYKNRGYNFMSLDSAKYKADSIINLDTTIYKDYYVQIQLLYNINENDLFWFIDYYTDYEEKGKIENSVIRTFVFSMINHQLYRDYSRKTFYFQF